MNSIQPLTQSRIRGILDGKSIGHTIDGDGDIAIPLGADSDVPYDVVVFLMIKSEGGGILQIRGIPDRNVASARRVDAVLFCNQWNTDRVWPTAYYNEKMNRIEAKISVDLSMGVHDEMLKDLSCTSGGLVWSMYKELARSGM
jgi:hypothetical protein